MAIRIFDGKRYAFSANKQTKTEAKLLAKNLRSRGMLARVAPAGRRGGYNVWFRRPTSW